jgi:diaminopimelate epimerase
MADPLVRRLNFFKMHGGGNDFVLIDHRLPILGEEDQPSFARRVCHRQTGVGADGLILLELSQQADLRWQFYNADGSAAEMCGNGARCAARYAVLTGMTGETLSLETRAGVIHADVIDRQARITMTGVGEARMHLEVPLSDLTLSGHAQQVGVPHVVFPVPDLEDVPVTDWGRAVRFHPLFQPAGANVNFIRVISPHALAVRTYERGVEDETLACGTGAVAAALVAARLGQVSSPVLVHTRGGEILTVSFQQQGDTVSDVLLEGEALVTFQGELWLDELK